MTSTNAVEIDKAVCRALEKKPGQSLKERARQILAPGSDATCGQANVARVLLDDSLEPWDAMARAAELAKAVRGNVVPLR